MPRIKQTVYESLYTQMAELSNHNLVEMWNALNHDQRSPHLVVIADVLKSREIKARRGKEIRQRWVSDEELARLKATGTTLAKIEAPVETPVEITPHIPTNKVLKAAKCLCRLMKRSQETYKTVDPFTRRRASSTLKKFWRRTEKSRLQSCAEAFAELAPKRYGVEVYRVKAGSTFTALIESRGTLLELRAGYTRGEEFVQARPISWSSLTEVR